MFYLIITGMYIGFMLLGLCQLTKSIEKKHIEAIFGHVYICLVYTFSFGFIVVKTYVRNTYGTINNTNWTMSAAVMLLSISGFTYWLYTNYSWRVSLALETKTENG